MISTNRINDDVVVIAMDAYVERADLRPLRQQLESLSDVEGLTVIVDFSETRHTYYRVADVLARYQGLFGLNGSTLVLAGMSRYLERIFTFVGYADSFKRFEQLADVIGEAVPA